MSISLVYHPIFGHQPPRRIPSCGNRLGTKPISDCDFNLTALVYAKGNSLMNNRHHAICQNYIICKEQKGEPLNSRPVNTTKTKEVVDLKLSLVALLNIKQLFNDGALVILYT